MLEDSPNGQLIGCVPTKDLDLSPTSLRFSIQSKAELPFRIDEFSGCLFLNSSKPLDYEKTSSYKFGISVLDGNMKGLSTECTAHIQIIDVDENLFPPQFSDVALEASIEGTVYIYLTLLLNFVFFRKSTRQN